MNQALAKVRRTISTPFIVAVLPPLVLFDIVLELYHHVCFPLYQLPLIQRSKYIKLDRSQLAYLGPLRKLFCAYCDYANGFILYAQAIAGETERYWCAIKNQPQPGFVQPPHHQTFAEYGDEQDYRKRMAERG